ncbi:mitotic spindle checkpoint protein BUBR1 [Neltuma alba]|uniref:mitotic spindle checkpoint protein BUBR1 n=1 Tax=Neltuma alba TaxID=207710 RepID=UPI0010A3620A|nr:mitotic spindle checkpoint protein BUBR1 [Prosopis alba]XP_028765754.1 mitotic spindle checkpoint protein BUBR1 [Prosopis alba]
MMADDEIERMDPETEYLMSNKRTGDEWEMFKENVRPLKRGRNINLLNTALNTHNDNRLKKSLLDNRRRLIEAIDEYKGDDPLLPWIECIKWVQESFPPGGDCSGLVVIYEQCVRTFWHSDRYKDDLRYLKVWLEYADNCIDADVIYSFLDANGIGRTHSTFYISYALYMESKNKIRAANEIFDLGISRNAQPMAKLKDAYRKFLARSMRRSKVTEEDSTEKQLPLRSFGTVLANGENRVRPPLSELSTKNLKPEQTGAVALTIYKDSTATDDNCPQQPEASKRERHSLHTLGARAERNKENYAIPDKWTTYQIPQRPGIRTGGVTASASIPVFVDEDCDDEREVKTKGRNSSSVLTRQEADQDLKRETELLRKKPLRNFPQNSLPR